MTNFKFQISNKTKKIRNYKLQIANLKLSRGFTVIEIILTMSVFLILLGIVTLNLNTARTQATLETTFETLLADLRQQQLKAMVGDTEGRTTSDTYGIHFDTDSYTLFHGTYTEAESSNFLLELPDSQQITSSFANDAVIFARGSGEIVNYDADADTITIEDTATRQQRTIELNKYGVVTGVN